ncbi:hypothetical protein CBR_g38664 [Chara braunii]|uniref:Reverse transcriptase domain-containing protein n=1 Tax=Chara braunii TaxID=69332 RepID=A0A388K0N5_CHABU|nr:hypothetical protein CBR_g38664 [Chara braunii]|eukprot:GBG63598.1 hypothetical protein CBR_g38664 [Chara braunii]
MLSSSVCVLHCRRLVDLHRRHQVAALSYASLMTYLYRRLPLLLLVVILLIVVVLFHVCISLKVPGRTRWRHSVKKGVDMDDRQPKSRALLDSPTAHHAQHSGARKSQQYDPSVYAHLLSHGIPLPPADDKVEEVGSRTVALGSGSTQDWAGSQFFGNRQTTFRQSHTQLLEEGIGEEDTLADVNLSFGLCSGSSATTTRTRIINLHPDDNWGDAALVGLSGGGSSRVQLPSQLSGGQVTGRRSGGGGVDTRFAVNVDERTGRQVWAEHRQQLRGDCEDAITRGVRQLHVDGSDVDKEVAVEVDDFKDIDEEDEDDEEGAVDIRPVGRTSMGGRGRSKKASAAHRRQTKTTASGESDGEGDMDVDGGRNFWSVEHMVALVRAKRDQDAHLEGMGQAFACMKPREWKCQDVHERLKKGVVRSGENCGKKWDNLMQQFKKGSAAKNHTIHPRNVADNGVLGGVEMPSGSRGGRGDGGGVGDVLGEPHEEEGGPTKGSSFSTGSTVGLAKRKNMRQQTFKALTKVMEKHDTLMGTTLESAIKRQCKGSSFSTGSTEGLAKRKNTRPQTFEALTDVMEKHVTLMATTLESASKRQCSMLMRQCEIMESEVDAQKKHYVESDDVSKLMIELLPGAVPPKGRIYRMSPAELDELRRQLETLASKGWIRPSTSEFGAAVLFVPKGNGEFRMCIDNWGLNKITRKSTEPLPRIDDLLDMVQGCTIFSKIDLKFGYHQIEMAEGDVHKTAFKTRYGTYEYLVMPFGLCNAPGTFQIEMHRILRPYLDRFVVVYLDDILIFLRGHDEDVTCLAMSSNGDLIASGQNGRNADVIVWSFAKRDLLFRMSEHDFGVVCVEFSHDDRLLCSIGPPRSQKIIIWDMSSGCQVAHRTADGTPIAAMAWGGYDINARGHPTSNYRLATSGRGTVRVWILDPLQGKLSSTDCQAGGVIREYTSLAFSHNGRYIFSGTQSGDIGTFSLTTFALQATFGVCAAGVTALIVASGGELIAGGGDGSVTIIRPEVHRDGDVKNDPRAHVKGEVCMLSAPKPLAREDGSAANHADGDGQGKGDNKDPSEEEARSQRGGPCEERPCQFIAAATKEGFVYKIRREDMKITTLMENHIAEINEGGFPPGCCDRAVTYVLRGSLNTCSYAHLTPFFLPFFL